MGNSRTAVVVDGGKWQFTPTRVALDWEELWVTVAAVIMLKSCKVTGEETTTWTFAGNKTFVMMW